MIETIRNATKTRNTPTWLIRALQASIRAVFLPSQPAEKPLVDTSSTFGKIEDESEIEAAVTRIYQLALGRPPSIEDRQMWANEVVSQRMSVTDVLEAIADSSEAALLRQREVVPAGIAVSVEDASEVAGLVTRIYELALGRTPSVEDRNLWVNEVISQRMSVAGIVEVISDSPEAKVFKQRSLLVPEVANGQFIQFAYEYLLERSPGAAEVVAWDYRFSQQNLDRGQFVLSLFEQRAMQALTHTGFPPAQDPTLSPLMGTDRVVKVAEWREAAAALGSDYVPAEPKLYPSLSITRQPEILVSAIASLYCGGEYIEQFLENITSQTIFRDYCELIIIDADSPENEAAVITRYMERFANIVYHRADARIGIYEAWNVGVRMARGRYLTNTNMDDLRRSDSFERQIEILEKFPFVDVVYQDFWYSFEGHAPFDRSAATGFKSEVPVVTAYNLMQSNSPHNAPMWRQELHDAVGMFDDTYRSAGDYDFWLRCMQAGKVFYKVNDPHVVYFVNPEGLSTRPNTRGVDEANRSTKLHGRNLLSPWLLSSDEAFVDEISRLAGTEIELAVGERAAQEWRYTAAQHALRALRVRSAASNSISQD